VGFLEEKSGLLKTSGKAPIDSNETRIWNDRCFFFCSEEVFIKKSGNKHIPLLNFS